MAYETNGGMGEANRAYIAKSSQDRIDNLHRGKYTPMNVANSYIRSNTHLLPSAQARRPLGLEGKLDFSYDLPSQKMWRKDDVKDLYRFEGSTRH